MNKPIRILVAILGNYHGGMETMIFQLYKNIDRSKIQMDFLTYHDVEGKIAYEDEILEMGGRVFRSYYALKERKSKDYISPYTFLRNHPEIVGVHFHANWITTQYRILIAAYILSKKIRIIHSHSVHHQSNLSKKDQIVEKFAKLTLKQITTDRLACSKQAGQWMFGRNEFAVINNGINVKKFLFNHNNRYSIRKKYGIEEDDFLLGTIGRIEDVKNPMFLIELIRTINENNVKLMIVGDGTLRNNIEYEIKKNKLDNRCTIIGEVDDAERFYSAFDLFVFPSKFEGFGLSLVEAQAAGLKCLSSNSVPKTTRILDKVEYFPLEMNLWKNKIYDHISCGNHYDRQVDINIFIKTGYDISDSSKKLQEIYIERLRDNGIEW